MLRIQTKCTVDSILPIFVFNVIRDMLRIETKCTLYSILSPIVVINVRGYIVYALKLDAR